VEPDIGPILPAPRGHDPPSSDAARGAPVSAACRPGGSGEGDRDLLEAVEGVLHAGLHP
jgi:hypothetical protein